MEQSEFIAAIDLGTSNITGVVGRKNDNDIISILACKTTPSNNSIRRGLVYNIEEVGAKVRGTIQMLENSLDNKIDKVYVSLSGQSLHTIEHRETITLSAGETITDNIIKQLRKSAEKFIPDMKRNYLIADVEYFVDGKAEQKPVGVPGSQIEARYKVIVGRPNMLDNISKSVREKANLKVAGSFVGALASATIALNDEEKMLGCAFIDFGGGTTTLSVYKGGILRKMAVIPFGGKNLTKDICELNFIEEQAEELKKKFGTALETKSSASKLSSPFSSPFSSKPNTDFTELNNAIKMRLDEITANIEEQIKQSGYEGQLGAGLVITGGASQLKNLDKYLTEKLKMPVRKASAKKTLFNNAPDFVNDPAFTQVLGMLLMGNEDCAKPAAEGEQPVPPPKRSIFASRVKPEREEKTKKIKKDSNEPDFSTGLWGFVSGLFDDPEEEKNESKEKINNKTR